MTGRRLKVLVVSEDRKTLRHIAQFLNVFGYDPRQAASVDQAQMALEADPPDFLILDGDLADAGGLQLAQSDGSYRGAGQIYTFLLVSGVQPRTLIEALEAGVDDFLTKPIVHGEVVVRLRAAARALEYDRRLQAQMGVDRSTDMPNRSALRTRLAQELNRSATGSRPPACVVIDIDALERINRSSGRPTGDRLIRDVAGVLQDQCEDGQWVACFGGGRFGVLLPQRSVGEAVEWAEAVHATLEKTEFVCADKVLRVTVSVGVAGCSDATHTASEAIEDALSALQQAKDSGRNCVVQFAQFDDEARQWAKLAAPGKLFETTRVRDVMIPCTLLLRCDDSVQQAAALFQSAQLRTMPVVDVQGQLVGIVSKSAVTSDAAQRVEEIMSTSVRSLDEEIPFGELMDVCSREMPRLIVVTCGGRPTGFVSPSQLATLTEPLTSQSFAPTEACSASSRYLLVADDSADDA